MFANYYGEIRGGRSFAGAQDDKEDWLRMAKGFPVEPGMTGMRAGMTERKQRERAVEREKEGQVKKDEGRPDEGRRKMKEGWNNAG